MLRPHFWPRFWWVIRMLQCVAENCSVLRCRSVIHLWSAPHQLLVAILVVAIACCRVLQHVAVCCSEIHVSSAIHLLLFAILVVAINIDTHVLELVVHPLVVGRRCGCLLLRLWCMCVCVCERERDRQRDIEREKDRERERIYCVRLVCPTWVWLPTL